MNAHRAPLCGVLLVVACASPPSSRTAAVAPVTQATASPAARPTPPTRDPRTPGYVRATELPDGAVPSAEADGNFIIGATHDTAPEMRVRADVPHGTVHIFTMSSADSKLYPGIARDSGTFGTPDPNDPTSLVVTTSHPRPYTRRVGVYVPAQYVAGTRSTVHRRRRRHRSIAVHRARQPHRAEARAADDRHLDRQRQWRRAGEPARARVRHDVRSLRGVRRDGGAAAGREAVRRATDEGPRRPRDDGLQLGRRGGVQHGVVPSRSVPPRALVLRHFRQSAVAAQRGDAARRVGVPRATDPQLRRRSRSASGCRSAIATCTTRT